MQSQSVFRAAVMPLCALCATLTTGCAPQTGPNPQQTQSAPVIEAVATRNLPPDPLLRPTATPAPPPVAAVTATAPPPVEPAATPSAVPAGAPTAAPQAPPVDGVTADGRQRIFDALNALNKRGPYRMRFTPQLPDEPPGTVLVVPPERMHVIIDNMDGSRFESIHIGTTVYANLDGTWTRPASVADLPIGTFKIESPAAIVEIINVSYLGVQAINGVNASGFTYQDVANPDDTLAIWIGPDGAPVRMISVGSKGAEAADIEYDSSISINAP
jgi:hypothetical protein